MTGRSISGVITEQWREGGYVIDFKVGQSFGEPQDVLETLAQVLRTFVAGKSGYLFATVKGWPLTHRNVLRALHAAKKIGLHAFRRFRLTWLRKSGVPKDLERFWMGHAPEEVGDLYSKLKDDELYRAHWAERIGLGFSVGQLGQLNVVSISKAKVA